jgi:hypothetical protein
MMQTVWLNSSQIKLLEKVMVDMTDELSMNIKRELAVANIRANHSRVLTKDFLIALDKKDKSPFRFNKAELTHLLQIAETSGIKKEDIL